MAEQILNGQVQQQIIPRINIKKGIIIKLSSTEKEDQPPISNQQQNSPQTIFFQNSDIQAATPIQSKLGLQKQQIQPSQSQTTTELIYSLESLLDLFQKSNFKFSIEDKQYELRLGDQDLNLIKSQTQKQNYNINDRSENQTVQVDQIKINQEQKLEATPLLQKLLNFKLKKYSDSTPTQLKQIAEESSCYDKNEINYETLEENHIANNHQSEEMKRVDEKISETKLNGNSRKRLGSQVFKFSETEYQNLTQVAFKRSITENNDEFKNNQKVKLNNHNQKQSQSYCDVQDQTQNQEIHIGFLHSSPLFNKEQEGKFIESDQINFQDESRAIQVAAQTSNYQVRYLQSVATKDLLIEMLSLKPKALHISCHGIQKKNPVQDFLLIELPGGEGELISKMVIAQYLIKYSVKLDLVFVAACKSEFVGRIFQQAGVKHVICVREGAEIKDEAVIQFTSRFYRNIFAGEKICKAFENAQTDVEVHNSKGQASMFKLLLEEEISHIKSYGLDPINPHVCYPFGPLKKGGKFIDLTDQIDLQAFPSPIYNLVGRESDLFQLVKNIVDKRLTCLVGVPGIGKSCLVRNALQFFSARRQFLGGILLIQAKGVDLTEVLVKVMIKEFLAQIKDEEIKTQIRNTAVTDPESLINHIVGYINRNNRVENNQNQFTSIYNTKCRNFLLVIDNAEMLIQQVPQKFKLLISELLNKCSLLSILITSRGWLLMDNINTCQFQMLQQIETPLDVHLFLKISGEIPFNEIYELLKLDNDFPFEVLKLKNLVKTWNGISNEQEEELLSKLKKSAPYRVDVLKEHALFQQMKGNPHSITLLACLRANPICQRTLCDIYNLVKSQNIKDLLAAEGINSEVFSNETSLRVSHEISLINLQKNSPPAYSFFFFLSLLPDGAYSAQLNKIWGEQWLTWKETLDKFGFLESECLNNNRIILKHFMITFAQEAIDQDSTKQYNKMITEFYVIEMKQIYRSINFVQDNQNSKAKDIREQPLLFILSEIKNILACIGRNLENKSQSGQQTEIINQLRKKLTISSDQNESLCEKSDFSEADCSSYWENSGIPNNLSGIDNNQVKDQLHYLQEFNQSLDLNQTIKKSKQGNQKNNQVNLQIHLDDQINPFQDKAIQPSNQDKKLLSVPKTSSQSTSNSPILSQTQSSSNLKINRENSNGNGKSFKTGSFNQQQNVNLNQNEANEISIDELSSSSRSDSSQIDSEQSYEINPQFYFKTERTQTKKQKLQNKTMGNLAQKIGNSLIQKLEYINNQQFFKMTTKKSIQSTNTNYQNQVFISKNIEEQIAENPEIKMEEELLLYVLSTMYLCNDSIQGFLLTSKVLNASITKSTLFNGNCIRLHALFLEQMFEQNVIEGKCSNQDNYMRINTATQYVLKALKVFNPENQTGNHSIHGTALSQFHLGQIYSRYAKQLLLPQGMDTLGDHDCRVYSVQDSYQIALQYHENAFESFQKINHIAGMYFSRLEATNLCEKLNQIDKHIGYAIEYSQYELDYSLYTHIGDEQFCTYIPRVKNRDSLLVELVLDNKVKNIFKNEFSHPSTQKSQFLHNQKTQGQNGTSNDNFKNVLVHTNDFSREQSIEQYQNQEIVNTKQQEVIKKKEVKQVTDAKVNYQQKILSPVLQQVKQNQKYLYNKSIKRNSPSKQNESLSQIKFTVNDISIGSNYCQKISPLIKKTTLKNISPIKLSFDLHQKQQLRSSGFNRLQTSNQKPTQNASRNTLFNEFLRNSALSPTTSTYHSQISSLTEQDNNSQLNRIKGFTFGQKQNSSTKQYQKSDTQEK